MVCLLVSNLNPNTTLLWVIQGPTFLAIPVISESFRFFCLFVLVWFDLVLVPGMELRTSCLPGRHCATELNPWGPFRIILNDLRCWEVPKMNSCRTYVKCANNEAFFTLVLVLPKNTQMSHVQQYYTLSTGY